MNEEIMGQLRFLLMSLCLGMAYILGYDGLRFIRFLIPHRKAALWMEDILFWSAAALPGFYLFLRFNYGIIRWYGAASVILGALFYEFGISRVIRSWGNRVFSARKRKFYYQVSVFFKKAGRWIQKSRRRLKKGLQKKEK